MTNETTASQPKSIGDDAQFLLALDHYAEAVRDGGIQKRVVARRNLGQVIDNFRAPAAQASATIQAAPTVSTFTLTGHQLVAALDLLAPGLPRDPEELDDDLTFGVVQHKDDDGTVATGMCCWNDDTDGVLPLDEHPDADAIQEPVMVAEPVAYADPKAFENFSAGTATNEWMWAKPDAGLVPIFLAAPMVADPAGVAGFAELRTGLKKLNRTTDCEHLIHQLDALAATVKALPSEAQYWIEAAADFVESINASQPEIAAPALASELRRLAALLAYKTDGGE